MPLRAMSCHVVSCPVMSCHVWSTAHPLPVSECRGIAWTACTIGSGRGRRLRAFGIHAGQIGIESRHHLRGSQVRCCYCFVLSQSVSSGCCRSQSQPQPLRVCGCGVWWLLLYAHVLGGGDLLWCSFRFVLFCVVLPIRCWTSSHYLRNQTPEPPVLLP